MPFIEKKLPSQLANNSNNIKRPRQRALDKEKY